MKKFRLFYSFQSDKPESNKVIRLALNNAKDSLKKQDIDLEIVVGAQNFAGMADIPAAIETNIGNCDLFLADLTPITYSNGKANPNANVMMELGQAKVLLGVSRMIGVAVIDEGDSWQNKDLPFDFNKNRIIIAHISKGLNLSKLINSSLDYILHPEKRLIEDIKERREKELNEKKIYPIDSTIFFTQRMAKAFPGVRGLQTITNKEQIKQYLDILLESPISFQQEINDSKGDIDPIWLFRGHQGIDVKQYRYLGHQRFLLGWDELNIDSISVFRAPGSYYKEYVYIEALADEPTGLYHLNDEWKKECLDNPGYIHEEYGVFLDEKNKECIINRAEYDDGAAIRNGKHYSTLNAELRVRHLSPINYLLTAKFSSYNCREFCQTSQPLMDGLLRKTVSFKQFHDYLMTFPKRDY